MDRADTIVGLARPFACSLTPLVAVGAASGQITTTELGPVDGDISISGSNATATLNIDFDGDSVAELRVRRNLLSGRLKLFVDGDASNSEGFNDEDEIVTSSFSTNPLALNSGDLIGPTAPAGRWSFASNNAGGLDESEIWSFQQGGSASEGEIPVDGNEYFIGVRTIIDGNTHYGWIGLILESETFAPLTSMDGYVTAIAYNTVPDEPIAAGDRGSEEPCPADVNGDGELNDSDFFAWVTAFTSNPRTPEDEQACDVNRSGECNDSDFFAWVTIFTGVGCP
ncbi:MAG: dockerin type I domain-containing protein [Planctomycetota bacterium]